MTRRLELRSALRLWWLDAALIAHAMFVHHFIYLRGFNIGGIRAFGQSVGVLGVDLLWQLAAGVILRILWDLARRKRDIRERLRTPVWWITTVRVWFASVLVVHSYGWLKLMLPYISPKWLDAELWELDQALLFGFSPNVLFLNALSNPVFLQIIDYLYSTAFFVTLLTSAAFFISHPDDRLRLSFAAGNAFLWIAGAWLYVTVPAFGPAFRFAEVWDPYWEVMPVSRAWQVRLLRNYGLVMKLRTEGVDPNLNFIYGIGAFPSLHVGFQLYFALWIRTLNRWFGIVFLIGVAVMFFGSIITGWHYMVDSLAGLVLGAVAWAAALLLWRRMKANDAVPSV